MDTKITTNIARLRAAMASLANVIGRHRAGLADTEGELHEAEWERSRTDPLAGPAEEKYFEDCELTIDFLVSALNVFELELVHMLNGMLLSEALGHSSVLT